MHHFVYGDLIRQSAVIDTLEVQSFEMNLYLVKIHIGTLSGMLYREDNTLMRFKSTQEIRDAFEDLEIGSSVMLHHSPYDEMIGNPPAASQPMQLPFSMTSPY